MYVWRNKVGNAPMYESQQRNVRWKWTLPRSRRVLVRLFQDGAYPREAYHPGMSSKEARNYCETDEGEASSQR
jgi:hypothetical protein